jgi:hypothetical protein
MANSFNQKLKNYWINAARPAVLAGVDAIIPPAGKRGIFTGQHGATGGPSFNKNPYAKK